MQQRVQRRIAGADKTALPATGAMKITARDDACEREARRAESRFSHNFANVRVHADERAAASAHALGADAFTIGQDVYFGAGRFAPHTSEGRRLLQHELAHTIQQRSGPLAIARQQSAEIPMISIRKQLGPEITVQEDKKTKTVKVFVDGVLAAELVPKPGDSAMEIDAQNDPATGALHLRIAITSNVDVKLSPAGKKLRPEVVYLDAMPVLLKPDPELRKPQPKEAPQESKPAEVKDLAGVTEADVEAADEPEDIDVAKIGVAIADITTDFVPIVSNIKDAITAITGVNPVTGEDVGVLDRVLAGIFAIPGVGNVLKYIGKGGKLLVKGIKALPKAIKAIGRGLRWLWRLLKKPIVRAAEWVAEKAKKIWERVTARLRKKDKPSTASAQPPKPQDTRWAKPATLEDHFTRHGADFGAKNSTEYAQMASDFLRKSQADRLPTKIDSRGTIRVYDPKTNTFASYNSDGTTKTFYKPDPAKHKMKSNLEYWDSQPGKLQ